MFNGFRSDGVSGVSMLGNVHTLGQCSCHVHTPSQCNCYAPVTHHPAPPSRPSLGLLRHCGTVV